MSVIEQVNFATWQSAHVALCHCNNVAKKNSPVGTSECVLFLLA